MSTTCSFTRDDKTDDGHLSDWVPRHLLDWRFALQNDQNSHRLMALCIAYFLLMCNANERAHGHGAYDRASEGGFLLVDNGQCHTPLQNGVELPWECRLRPCTSRKQLLCPRHAVDPNIAKPHTYANQISAHHQHLH